MSERRVYEGPLVKVAIAEVNLPTGRTVELEIVRHSFPYGDTREHGLFFIAYNRNLDTLEKMLARMIGTAADRRHDALLDYTRAVSGATFFAPSLRILRGLGR